MYRLFGHGTSCSELVEFVVSHPKKKPFRYLVLVSETVPGTNLASVPQERLKLNPINLSNFFLSLPLILPGDMRPANFIVQNDRLICVDNDVSFVKPVVTSSFFSNFSKLKYNLYTVLPFLFPDYVIDKQAINDFLSLSPGSILPDWLAEIKEYNSIVKEYFKSHETKSYTSECLFEEGMGGQIFSQFCHMQSFLQVNHERDITGEELLKLIISFDEGKITDIGEKIHHKYQKAQALENKTPSEKIKWVTDRDPLVSVSMTQSQTLYYTYLPSDEKDKSYLTPEQAIKEIENLLFLDFQYFFFQDQNKLARLEKGFKEISDIKTQKVLLEILKTHTYERLDLSNCKALTDNLLKDFLEKSKGTLKSLILRNCPRLTKNCLPHIAICTRLEELFFRENLEIKSFVFQPALRPPKEIVLSTLKILSLSNCNLSEIHLCAPKLLYLKAKGNSLTPEKAKLNIPDTTIIDSDDKPPKIDLSMQVDREKVLGVIASKNFYVFEKLIFERHLSIPKNKELFEKLHQMNKAIDYRNLDLSNAKFEEENIEAFRLILLFFNDLITINFKNCQINPSLLNQITLALRENKSIKSIDLSNNALDKEALDSIIFLIDHSPALNELNLSNNNLINEYECNALYEALKKRRAFPLTIYGFLVEGIPIDFLSKLLHDDPSISEIKVPAYKFTPKGMKILSEFFLNPNIRRVVFSQYSLKESEGGGLFDVLKKRNFELQIEGVTLGRTKFEEFTKFHTNKKIEVDYNYLTPELIFILLENANLTELSIYNLKNISDFSSLLSITQHPTCQRIILKDLSYQEIGNYFKRGLEQLLQTGRSKKIHLKGVELLTNQPSGTEIKISHICSLEPENISLALKDVPKYITVLDLANQSPREKLHPLFKEIQNLEALNYLSIVHSGLTDVEFDLFLRNLNNNHKIKNLCFSNNKLEIQLNSIFRNIKKIEFVEHIDLRKNNIQPYGKKTILKCTHIKEVNLEYNPTGIIKLYGLYEEIFNWLMGSIKKRWCCVNSEFKTIYFITNFITTCVIVSIVELFYKILCPVNNHQYLFNSSADVQSVLNGLLYFLGPMIMSFDFEKQKKHLNLNLRSNDLRDENMNSLKNTLGYLINLQKIDLSYNQIKNGLEKLKKTLRSLGQLETILLNNNQIETIKNFSEELSFLKKLSEIDLSHNQISEVSANQLVETLYTLPDSQRITLKIEGNQFDIAKATRITQRLKIPKTVANQIAFGRAKWEKYFGDLEAEPPLPANIDEILNSPCPFWSGKKVRETHLLVLVPQTVNGRVFCLDSLSELIKNPKIGHKTQYRAYYDEIKKELGSKSVPSHWVLMTRDVIPGSRNKTYDVQKRLVQSHAQKTKLPYKMLTALDAATAILTHYVETGKRIYKPYLMFTYGASTRCQEILGSRETIVIGGFDTEGLAITTNDWHDYIPRGVGCCLYIPVD
ncbi:MAG: hypothetical protein KDK71_03315 [Chlamydiia bacterium]|nr:hypothetical protein [Chlamydiia bacterium]